MKAHTILGTAAVAMVLACHGDDPLGPGDVAGTWAGSTSQGRAFSFVVAGGTFVQGLFSYTLQGEDCPSVTGAVVIEGGASVPIDNGEFRVPRTQIGQTTFLSAEGRFTSATRANGTFTVNDRDCETRVTWTATKQ